MKQNIAKNCIYKLKTNFFNEKFYFFVYNFRENSFQVIEIAHFIGNDILFLVTLGMIILPKSFKSYEAKCSEKLHIQTKIQFF